MTDPCLACTRKDCPGNCLLVSGVNATGKPGRPSQYPEKRDALAQCLSAGMTEGEIARRLGVTDTRAKTWIRRYRGEGER